MVGRDGGYTAQVADASVIVPTVNPETVTPQAEAFQAVVWHLLVSHPRLKANAFRKLRSSDLKLQIRPFCEENLRSGPHQRQTEKRPGGAEIPVG